MSDEQDSERWSRKDWWGVVLEAPDVAELVQFYSKLRGWIVKSQSESWATLDPGNGTTYLAIQLNLDYETPVWPNEAGRQQMMVHLDFEVINLEKEVDRAIELGAIVATFQPQENVRVLLDPAGHPFCLYVS